MHQNGRGLGHRLPELRLSMPQARRAKKAIPSSSYLKGLGRNGRLRGTASAPAIRLNERTKTASSNAEGVRLLHEQPYMTIVKISAYVNSAPYLTCRKHIMPNAEAFPLVTDRHGLTPNSPSMSARRYSPIRSAKK